MNNIDRKTLEIFDIAFDEADEDGLIFEAYIADVSITEWNLFLIFIKEHCGNYKYFEGATEFPLPENADGFLFGGDNSPFLQINVTSVLLECIMHEADKIEFNINPDQMRTPDKIEAVLKFLNDVSTAIHKMISFSVEGLPAFFLIFPLEN